MNPGFYAAPQLTKCIGQASVMVSVEHSGLRKGSLCCVRQDTLGHTGAEGSLTLSVSILDSFSRDAFQNTVCYESNVLKATAFQK